PPGLLQPAGTMKSVTAELIGGDAQLVWLRMRADEPRSLGPRAPMTTPQSAGPVGPGVTRMAGRPRQVRLVASSSTIRPRPLASMKPSGAIPMPAGAGRIPSSRVNPGGLRYTAINAAENPLRPAAATRVGTTGASSAVPRAISKVDNACQAPGLVEGRSSG